MKFRLLQLMVPLFFLAVMSSCTRDYICQCTIKYSGQPGLPDSTLREYPIKDTKKKAQGTCEGNSQTHQTGDIIAEETCRLY